MLAPPLASFFGFRSRTLIFFLVSFLCAIFGFLFRSSRLVASKFSKIVLGRNSCLGYLLWCGRRYFFDQEILEKQTAPGSGTEARVFKLGTLQAAATATPTSAGGALGILFRFQIADFNLFFLVSLVALVSFLCATLFCFLLLSFSSGERFSNILLGKNSRRNAFSGVEGAHGLIKKRSRHRTSVHLCSSFFALPISIFLFRCFPSCHSHRRVFAARL